MKANWKNELASRLITARGGESQARLGARAGVSDRTIGLIEQKKVKVLSRPRTIARLAIATGSDPSDWLRCAGLKLKSSEIDSLRGSIGMQASWDQLEPASEIKKQLREYVDQAISRSEMRIATQLRNELWAYIDSVLPFVQQNRPKPKKT